MFYNQPIAARFGSVLQAELRDPRWTRLDASVAWVRRSGLKHLKPDLEAFLARGGQICITVGVDLANTSREGLEGLVALERYGDAISWVHHNEAATTFHPKVYLFESALEARLFVASNNLTESGLYTNAEGALQLDLPPTDATLSAARQSLASWRDPETGLARRLTRGFIEELETNGYIRREAALNRDRVKRPRTPGSKRVDLFASTPYAAPVVLEVAKPHSPKEARRGVLDRRTFVPANQTAGAVLLLRPNVQRGSQVQIPKKLLATRFFDGVTTITSQHSGAIHPLSPARARGAVNTIKAEIPESRTLTEPVMRLQRSAAGVVTYQVFETASPQGTEIWRALWDGFQVDPPLTETTRRAPNLNSGTWWRYI